MFEFIDFVSKVVQGTCFVTDSHSPSGKKKERKAGTEGKSLPFPPLVQLEKVFSEPGLNCTSIGNPSIPRVCLE